MIINHNMSSINANRNVGLNDVSQTKGMEKLASGVRINRAGDDAAGLAVSEKMRAQVRGLNQAVRNINDGISFVQTAEGYLQQTTESVQRIRELAVQSANGVYSEEDRGYIQVEVSQLVREVDRIASQGQFNGMTLFTGRFDAANGGTAMRLQMGANMDQSDAIAMGVMTAGALGLGDSNGGAAISLADADSANAAIGVMDGALQIINKQRADLGAYQNRMEVAVKGQMNAAENIQAAESQIRDTNMATAAVDNTRNMILMNASTAMLAQANQKSQSVMRLLG
jgi:flagellin